MTPSFKLNVIALAFGSLALTAPVVARAATPTRAAVTSADPTEPLVIISTNDINGKTGPCGCHIPKGGLARLSGFADSMRIAYPRVLLVDNGGSFPEDDAHQPQSAFIMDGLKLVGAEAVGVGERDLRFGLDYLRTQARRSELTLVCANLVDTKSRKPAFAPYTIRQVGGVHVGLFGLIGKGIDLGPARDSLRVDDPATAAVATIKELKARGATVIVLLSQLGKVGSEDLVSAVDGIDAAIVGHDTPIIEAGRKIKNTLTLFGGDESRYVGRLALSLDPRGHVASSEGQLVALGPEITSNAAIAELVKHFEDDYNARQAALQPAVHAVPADTLREATDKNAASK